MQRDAAELIEFWGKKFNIELPNENLNLFEIEQVVYRYKISNIIRIATKLKEPDVLRIITHLKPRENCISFDWDNKLEAVYSWIVSYFHPHHMGWKDFHILIEMGMQYDTNIICGLAQQLINQDKPLSLPYLRKVIESEQDQDAARRLIGEQAVNTRIVSLRGDDNKKSIDTSDLLDRFKNELYEI